MYFIFSDFCPLSIPCSPFHVPFHVHRCNGHRCCSCSHCPPPSNLLLPGFPTALGCLWLRRSSQPFWHSALKFLTFCFSFPFILHMQIVSQYKGNLFPQHSFPFLHFIPETRLSATHARMRLKPRPQYLPYFHRIFPFTSFKVHPADI